MHPQLVCVSLLSDSQTLLYAYGLAMGLTVSRASPTAYNRGGRQRTPFQEIKFAVSVHESPQEEYGKSACEKNEDKRRAVTVIINRVRMNIPSSGVAVLSRSRNVPLSVPQVLHAAQVPFGVPDPYPADPTHPSAWYTCRAGSQPAISPIPCPWHRARPTCAWRHVRSTFNLSRCLCASLCMCNTWLLHVQMGWACLDWR